MKRLRAMLALLTLSGVAFALPSVDAVLAELQRGSLNQAERMVREVIAAKPDSAKAHYLYAEILARTRRFEQAIHEARLSRQLDPDVHFMRPEIFRAFELQLERDRRAPPRVVSKAPAKSPPQQPKDPQAPPSPAIQERIGNWLTEHAGDASAWLKAFGLASMAMLLWSIFNAGRQAFRPAPAYPAARRSAREPRLILDAQPPLADSAAPAQTAVSGNLREPRFKANQPVAATSVPALNAASFVQGSTTLGDIVAGMMAEKWLCDQPGLEASVSVPHRRGVGRKVRKPDRREDDDDLVAVTVRPAPAAVAEGA